MILPGFESDTSMQREPRRPAGRTSQPQWGDEGHLQSDNSVRHSAVVIHGHRYSLGESDTTPDTLPTLTRHLSTACNLSSVGVSLYQVPDAGACRKQPRAAS